ncbi:MAG: hypothetical protein AAGE94_25430, partial [Acidobacteriota bacterium]
MTSSEPTDKLKESRRAVLAAAPDDPLARRLGAALGLARIPADQPLQAQSISIETLVLVPSRRLDETTIDGLRSFLEAPGVGPAHVLLVSSAEV